MDRADLDRWLSDDDAIVPSSGFASSVMDAVQREASGPQAIPFPWKRALPGLAVVAASLGGALWSGLRVLDSARPARTASFELRSLMADPGVAVSLTALLTLILVVLSMQLVRGRT